jgi:hypothetical protein
LAGNAGVGRVPMPADFMAPPSYNSREARQAVAQHYAHSLRPDPLYGGIDAAQWDKVVETNRVIVGSPKTVAAKVASRGLGEERPAGFEVGEIGSPVETEAAHLGLAALSGPEQIPLPLPDHCWDSR